MLTFLGSCLLLRKSITLVLSKSFYRSYVFENLKLVQIILILKFMECI